MTFAPDFAFYRDGPAIDRDLPDSFWEDFRQEARDELEQRRTMYPGLVTKGRMSRADADREARVWRAIAEDHGAAPRSADAPIATWTEQVHCLRRAITLRRNNDPKRVLQGRLDAADADRRLLLLEQWHDALWHSINTAEARAARRATPAITRLAA